MFIERSLKYALPALLIAAGATTYAVADNAEVTLSNGTPVTWADFVAVLNGDKTVTGDVNTLPENNAALTALNDAKKDKQDAEEELNAVNAEDSEYQKAIDSATTELELAEETKKTEAEKVSTAKTAYDNAEAAVKALQDQYDANEAEIARQNNLIYGISGYNNTLGKYNNQRADLVTKKDNVPSTTKTTYVPEGWLNTIIGLSDTYNIAYDSYYNMGPSQDISIYYIMNTNRAGSTLYLSFDEPADETLVVGGQTLKWMSATSTEAMYNILYPGGSALNITLANIYLGSNYKSNNGILKINPYTGIHNLFSDAYAALETLGTNPAYSTSSTEKVYTDADAKLIEDYDKQIAAIDKNIQTVNENIGKAEAEIERLTGLNEGTENKDGLKSQIDNYTNADGKTVSELETAYNDALEAQKPFDEAVSTATENLTKATNALADAKTTAQNKYDSAASALTTAEKDAQDAADAIALATYNSVTLAEDVTATTMITAEYKGTINGNGHIINAPANGAIFDTFGGRLSNVAINGTTYHNNDGARFTNVARWSTDGGVFYGDGTSATYETLGELGFAARARFGVDFANNELAVKGANTTVYNVTVYEFGKNAVPQYVTVNTAKQFVSASKLEGFTIPTNHFAKSATNDLKGIANVFYNNNSCDDVVITDKANFYCPEEITATTVSYDRVFKGGADDTVGFSAVCLPFELVDNSDDYDIFTFQMVEKQKFWFTKSTSVAANKPALIHVKSGKTVTGSDLATSTIEKTEAQIVMDGGATNDPSVSYGTFKNVNPGQFNGESNIKYIYGLNSSNKFQAASATANFSAFRMVVGTETPVFPLNAPMRAPGEYIEEYGIGILDENGNDITDQIMTGAHTTGVEDVEALEFSINGGQGVITITSDADYGTVPVYTLDGKLVATADVVAGTTTTVNVQTGVYVVMGKKVLVK